MALFVLIWVLALETVSCCHPKIIKTPPLKIQHLGVFSEHCVCIGANIKCADLNNMKDLKAITTTLNGSKIVDFYIENSTMDYLPHDVFRGLQVMELVLQNVQLRALTDTDIALEGLEESLYALTLKNFEMLTEWRWYPLRKLQQMVHLELNGGYLEAISENVKEIGHLDLNNFTFVDNELYKVADGAFALHEELNALIIRHNKISEIKRNILPDPALALVELDFSHNLIHELPEDAFLNMPSLKRVFLNHNKILTLKKEMFVPVWNQLTSLIANDNLLRCDCRVSWMIGWKHPDNAEMECEEPPTMKGRKVFTLEYKDLWC